MAGGIDWGAQSNQSGARTPEQRRAEQQARLQQARADRDARRAEWQREKEQRRQEWRDSTPTREQRRADYEERKRQRRADWEERKKKRNQKDAGGGQPPAADPTPNDVAIYQTVRADYQIGSDYKEETSPGAATRGGRGILVVGGPITMKSPT